MEKENLYRLIKGDSLENVTINELKRVTEEYPYFQTARLLYTKKLQISENEEYGEELSKTAILCADRRKLFYMIQPGYYDKLIYNRENNLTEEKDRTEALLDSYFTSFGNEHVNTPTVESAEITYVSTDYFGNPDSIGVDNNIDSTHQPFEHEDIIDAFINNNDSKPMRIRPHNENRDSSNKNSAAKNEKIDEGNEFLTETLAKIYIKQKKYEQALTIIKRLSLTFPKKSSYFADQIRFLEYLIINEKTNK